VPAAAPTLGIVLALVVALPLGIAMGEWSGRAWEFDAGPADEPPAGFTFVCSGGGRAGRWVVRTVPDAPSGSKVLAQVAGDPSAGRSLLAVAEAPSLRDVRLSVRCRPLAGRLDRSCGLLLRYQDAGRHYLVRASARDGEIRLDRMDNGRPRHLARWRGPVRAGEWRELRIDAQEGHLAVYWDGSKVLDAHDDTLLAAGRVGVATSADSVTEFDDLMVVPLEGCHHCEHDDHGG
jgi:hypothetical protein